MPSILVEAGFISNKEEEEYMNSEQGQNEIVKNIAAAIKQYIYSVTDNPKKDGEGQSTNVNNVAILLNENRKKIPG